MSSVFPSVVEDVGGGATLKVGAGDGTSDRQDGLSKTYFFLPSSLPSVPRVVSLFLLFLTFPLRPSFRTTTSDGRSWLSGRWKGQRRRGKRGVSASFFLLFQFSFSPSSQLHNLSIITLSRRSPSPPRKVREMAVWHPCTDPPTALSSSV